MLTADILEKQATAFGAGVAEKVRLADALESADSSLTAEEYGYALKAHFDFVVVTGDEHAALFAVEFDGPTHDTDRDVQRRDALKDAICAKLGMPLLRIREEHLLDVRHEPILAWLVAVWFLAAAFEPVTGEPFNYRLTMAEPEDRPAHILTFVPDARRHVFDFLVRDAGGADGQAVASDGTRTLTVTLWFPFVAAHEDPDGDGNAHAYAFLRLKRGGGFVGKSRCRAIHFGPIRPGDIASELALLDVADAIESLELRQARPSDLLLSESEFAALLAATSDWDRHSIFVPELPL